MNGNAGMVERVARALPVDRPAVVAIDGIGASGKTMFSAALAAHLDAAAIVVHADDHLADPTIRYSRGRLSPDGHWLDAYDHDSLLEAVGRARSTSPVTIAEGIFLHRDELEHAWDFSIWLHVPFNTAAERMVRRGTATDLADPRFGRWFGAQRLYFAAAAPWNRADVVIDNTDVEYPTVVERRTIFDVSFDATDR